MATHGGGRFPTDAKVNNYLQTTKHFLCFLSSHDLLFATDRTKQPTLHAEMGGFGRQKGFFRRLETAFQQTN